MKIKDKINLDRDGLIKYGPITIVAFGDSVTHGALIETEQRSKSNSNRIDGVENDIEKNSCRHRKKIR